MNPKFAPKNPEDRLARLIEEVGEVMTEGGALLQAIGKAGRFGMESTHPTGGPKNRDLILVAMSKLRMEMKDLEGAILGVETDILDGVIAADLARVAA